MEVTNCDFQTGCQNGASAGRPMLLLKKVWLCCRRDDTRLLCAVIQSEQGMLITAYPSDGIKQGDVIWKP